MTSLSARSLIWFAVIGLIIGLACSSDREPEITEVFSGELYTDRGIDSVGGETVDTIVFMLRGNQYSLFHLTNKSKYCDSEGRATGYGFPRLTLVPQATFGSGCDSLHVPQGAFEVTYLADNGLILDRTDTAMSTIWQFRLTPH